jgi:hypothetical protein
MPVPPPVIRATRPSLAPGRSGERKGGVCTLDTVDIRLGAEYNRHLESRFGVSVSNCPKVVDGTVRRRRRATIAELIRYGQDQGKAES